MGKPSKNNTSQRDKYKVKIVTSEDCEQCLTKCQKGISYVEKFNIKGQGNGVPCLK